MSLIKAPETLAVFDFDGTLTTRDTMLAFCRFVVGKRRYFIGLLQLAPLLLAYRVGILNNVVAKEAFLKKFLVGVSRETLERLGQQFCDQVLPGILRDRGLQTLRHHQQAGHQLLVITASLDFWVAPWAASMRIPLLASAGSFGLNGFTGQLVGPNCHGPEKVKRLRAWLDGQRPLRIIAYGDSEGDQALLEFADEAHYKPWR